jgi:S1-C subfamily serine protease
MGIKKLILVFFATMALFSCTSGCGAAVSYIERPRYVSDTQHVDHMMNSVVALVQTDPETGGTRAFCTAFFINDHVLATAAHCVATYTEVEVLPGVVLETREDPQIGDTFHFMTYLQFQMTQRHSDVVPADAHVLAFNDDTDVALLSLDARAPRSANWLQINDVTLSIGEQVYALGQPVGMPWILTDGLVSQVLRNPDGSVVEIAASANIFFGNSGGPLINDHGEVIGVASAIVAHQSHLGIWSPIRNIVALLNSLRPMQNRL